LKHCFDKNDPTSYVQSYEGQRGKSGFQLLNEFMPRGILDGRINERGAQVIRGKGSNGKSQDAGYGSLDDARRVEEKDLRFGFVDTGARGFREVLQKGLKDGCFLS